MNKSTIFALFLFTQSINIFTSKNPLEKWIKFCLQNKNNQAHIVKSQDNFLYIYQQKAEGIKSNIQTFNIHDLLGSIHFSSMQLCMQTPPQESVNNDFNRLHKEAYDWIKKNDITSTKNIFIRTYGEFLVKENVMLSSILLIQKS